MDRLFTIEEVRKLLKVSRGSVIGWIKSGRLKAVKLSGGRLWRIRERDLQKIIK